MSSFPGPHADYIIDRRRLRRKVTFWRIGAFLLVLMVILAGGWRLTSAGTPGPWTYHIARVQIEGLITGDRKTLDMLKDIGKSRARAVVLSIESPGGTTTGSEKLYEELRQLNRTIPVVAVLGNVAASGAYITALSADHIVARKNSLVGSIGVLLQLPNVSKLLDTLGVKVETIRSTPLKAAPSGLEPTTPEARQAMADIVADSYGWFKDLVKARRNLSEAELRKVTDGRVFTGRQSLGLKLVDEIGGEREAIAWLVREKRISPELKVRDWEKRSGSRFGAFTTAAALADLAGLDNIAQALRRHAQRLEITALDGLLAVWQSGDLR